MKAVKQLKQSPDQYKAVAVSTGHLTAEDAVRLGTECHPMILHRDTGAFVKLYEHTDESRSVESDYPGFSPAFYQVLDTARQAGFMMVEFDCDAPAYDGLEWYDW